MSEFQKHLSPFQTTSTPFSNLSEETSFQHLDPETIFSKDDIILPEDFDEDTTPHRNNIFDNLHLVDGEVVASDSCITPEHEVDTDMHTFVQSYGGDFYDVNVDEFDEKEDLFLQKTSS